jgi:CheY-like chemotaxis protein
MKILVVDDNSGHLQTARDQFPDDDVLSRDSYEDAIKSLEIGRFDLALFDLLMPAERHALGSNGMKFFGHEMPVGLIMVLLAARAGIPKIVCITDTNHHDHPMSALLDFVTPSYWGMDGHRFFQINGSKVLIAHAPMNGDGKDWREAYEMFDA